MNIFLNLPSRKNVDKISFADIIYLESSSNYTIIHLQNGKKKLSSRTMLYHIQNSLDSNFVRIHRAYCVNRNFILNYDYKLDPEIVQLATGKSLAVSRRKQRDVEKMLCE